MKIIKDIKLFTIQKLKSLIIIHLTHAMPLNIFICYLKGYKIFQKCNLFSYIDINIRIFFSII